MACVTSYAIRTNGRKPKKNRRARITTDSNNGKKAQTPPAGSTNLGTGSAFSVTSDGYLLTNYHVIERAYGMQQTATRLESFNKNVTDKLGFGLPFKPEIGWEVQVYVQLNSSRDNLPLSHRRREARI